MFHHAKKYKQALTEFIKYEKEAKKELELSYSYFKSLFSHTPSAIIIYEVINNGKTGADYIIKSANLRCYEMEDFDEDVTGKLLSQVKPNIDEYDIIKVFRKVWQTGNSQHYTAKAYRKNKLYRWYDNIIFKLPTGELVTVYDDVTEEKQKQERIEYLTYRDSLTGLYNRTFLADRLKNPKDKGPAVLILGDLVGTKMINDAFGYSVGDLIIKKAAKAIKKCCRPQDIVLRWGGDEFLIILVDATQKLAENICDKIRKTVGKINVSDMATGISLGYSNVVTKFSEFYEALSDAESFMLKRKMLEEKGYRGNILNSIKTALFEKSNETEEHGERLALYCRKIGEELKLTPNIHDELEIFSVLHDIGKIAIDNKILEKASKLNDSEWQIIKKHPETGYRIASSMPGMQNIAEYILAHHERWDGKGYPQGLKGTEIPLSSRILAVADAYDAMINDRAYRKALTKDAAIKELLANAGTQFDPKIVEIFVKSLKK